ncbi:pentapeptide repeat-containing protein [Streptomyces sp. NBC_00885]|nr:pentapeptide repeat-containing protein [Streptomyces sp. NBC_00885]
MMHPSPDLPPRWPHCGHGAAQAAPVGCRGIHVPGHDACLAHLDDADRTAYLATLAPGADIDHRGTVFTEELLSELLTALRDLATDRPCLGRAQFGGAKFSGDARFGWAKIGGDASFNGVEIGGDARFNGVEIGGDAWFDGVEIGGDASFSGAEIGGDAWFDGAKFGGHARFDGTKIGGHAGFRSAEIGGHTSFDAAEIGGHAGFRDAKFSGDAWFSKAEIGSYAGFRGAEIGGDASFSQAKIGGDAWFGWAEFNGDARFNGVEIGGDASFSQAKIGGDARFGGALIGGDAQFLGVLFERAAVMGPLACTGTLDLSEAVFEKAVIIEAATAALMCWRTRWAQTAALRLRHATVDLSDAVLEYPVSIAARSRPFIVDSEEMAEAGLTDPRVRAVSLRGVDAAHLVLTDIDLTDCRFAGTVHLDQLRLEGRYTLAAAPSGLRRRGMRPMRWTPRRTLAEEHHWRAGRGTATSGWKPAPEGEEVLEPAALAPVYRQLRKAFEDGKHEPGAADFYYGEMEMRRHADDIPWAERSLLTAYWALSGYGLRASRALGWLLAAMTATVLAMMLWGLPQGDPKPTSTGTLTGRSITTTTETPDPVNPDGPFRERLLSTERFEKSLRVVINSVVFRSSGQDLTTTGTYTEMATRLTEPVLLGLAVLAIRGRVKR